MFLLNLERAMGLEPTALCLGRAEARSAPKLSLLNLSMHVNQSKQMVVRFPISAIIA